MKVFPPALFLFTCFINGCSAQAVSPLSARGYTVIPYPQQVVLREHDFVFGSKWQLVVESGLSPGDPAVQTLKDLLSERFGLTLGGTAHPDGVLLLRIRANSVLVKGVKAPEVEALQDQAYAIALNSRAISITANSSTGLFYGIETLVQLLRSDGSILWLPEGQIRDWPDLQLRHIFWDLSHHLEPVAEIKRNIRQAAFYKINGFVLKMDGHFQYKSAPALVEPYALSPAELQDLTDYARRYQVQLIPYLDGPGHLAFLLKHPEFARLREFKESNYEICSTNPETYKLLEGMYQNLLDANRGGNYFYLSTDEAYYVGLAHSKDCDEKSSEILTQSPGKVLAHFVSKAGDYLHRRGRTVIFWGEYPLKPEDVPYLPKYLVSGEVSGPDFDAAFTKRGIHKMIYTSGEGEEQLFPDYALLPDTRRLHLKYSGHPRVEEITSQVSLDFRRFHANLIGEVNASWSDEGVHPETFWLGYVASASAGWHPGLPDPRELARTFYSLFYGAKITNIDAIYQMMSNQAQFFADSWETVSSNVRGPIWGDSYHINDPPKPAHDQTLALPKSPDESLVFVPEWAAENDELINRTAETLLENDTLIGMLHQALQQARMNRYGLEVYLSIAQLCRQNLAMIEGIHRMVRSLAAASELRILNPAAALANIDQALAQAEQIRMERNTVLAETVRTWDKSWLPRVSDANGRHFLHVLDNVKDHLPDRTIDMSYLIYRELLLPLGLWVETLSAARNTFAVAHHLSTKRNGFNWQNIEGSVGPHGSTLPTGSPENNGGKFKTKVRRSLEDPFSTVETSPK